MSKGIYKFEIDCYYSEISGLFISTSKEVKKAMGKTLHLGEVAGKHSDVEVDLDSGCIKLVSEKEDAVVMFEELGLEIGTNPIEELAEQEEYE
jgi:hypothetical protein